MLNAIGKVNMLDTESVVAFYFGSNRRARKDTIALAPSSLRCRQRQANWKAPRGR
jgi:hypothetical protein